MPFLIIPGYLRFLAKESPDFMHHVDKQMEVVPKENALIWQV